MCSGHLSLYSFLRAALAGGRAGVGVCWLSFCGRACIWRLGLALLFWSQRSPLAAGSARAWVLACAAAANIRWIFVKL